MSQYVRAKQSYLRDQAQRYPAELERVPYAEWPPVATSHDPVEVWRSRDFFVQVYVEHGHVRLSVNRTTVNNTGRWQDGISWDDMQRLKRECGRGDCWAVEIYPDDENTINDANMRHLWLLSEPPPYGWRVAGIIACQERDAAQTAQQEEAR